jgi:6-phosphogluconolactonase (cycloisomerase 2 family)
MKLNFILALVAAVVGAGAVSAQTNDANLQGSSWHAHEPMPRAVYTQTNAADGNEVLVFQRNFRGELHLASRAKTHGLGTGAGLGSQGALALAPDGRHLYVVNAGSDTISTFAVGRRGLALVGRVASGGDQPISLTLKHDVLYVLNAGTEQNIKGFRIAYGSGRLQALPDSVRPLSGAAVQPAQVLFNNTGDFLVVTEKATNKIDVYAVDDDGRANGPNVRDSNGATPFGFSFDRRDRLVVSEAFGGAPDASAVSSYDFDAADAPLDVISGTVKTMQTAACWVAITRNGRYAYVTNTGSGTISGYRIARNGELALLSADGVSASTGAGSNPQDLALSRKNGLLFALSPATGTLDSFRVLPDGSLTHVATAQGLPASAQGLAAN